MLRAVAIELDSNPDHDGFPTPSAWRLAPLQCFQTDWQGKNPDPQRETHVQLLWTHDDLYLRFRCRYREITVFPDGGPHGRRDKLWERDVAEVFLQPDPSQPMHYLEFEVSPNGQWIDLKIDRTHNPPGVSDLNSGLRRRVFIDQENKIWAAELAVPMSSIAPRFNSSAIWRVNFFRVEGKAEPRFYSAWSPTNARAPNFHVPEVFGKLLFAPPPSLG